MSSIAASFIGGMNCEVSSAWTWQSCMMSVRLLQDYRGYSERAVRCDTGPNSLLRLSPGFAK